jgi:hypothetical protein
MRTAATYTEGDLRSRLRRFEAEYRMESEEFLMRWEAGTLPHRDAFFAWAGLCSRLGVPEREPA